MKFDSSRLRPLAVAALLACTGAAFAEPNPYYIGVAQTFTRDSNIYRGPVAVSDTISSTGVLAGINQPIGRQRITGSLTARNNRFSELDLLNNTSYGLNAALDWSTIGKLSGTLSYAANQSLINYSNANLQGFRAKNMERTQQWLFRGQYGMASLLVLDTTWKHRTLRYSDASLAAFASREVDVDSGSVGVTWRPSDLLSLGAALRLTDGSYPRAVQDLVTGVYTPDDFRRHDIDLTANWVASGHSTLSGRISVGRERHERASARDFSGVTGQVNWVWRPTGKLRFETGVSRDTGIETTFFDIATPTDTVRLPNDNSRFTTTLRWNGTYAATAKINLTSSLRYARRTYGNSLFSGGGHDRTRAASLGVNYAPTTHLSFACELGRDSRSVEGNISLPYAANTASCSAQYVLQ